MFGFAILGSADVVARVRYADDVMSTTFDSRRALSTCRFKD